MDLDVLYRIPEDQIYQNVKDLVRRKSVDLILYCPHKQQEKFIIKKNLFALFGLVKDEGTLAISCFHENISTILGIIEIEHLYLDPGVLIISTEDESNKLIRDYNTYITCSKTSTNGIFIDNVNVNTPNESIVSRLSKVSEVVLTIGDTTLDAALFAKRMCRHVICFAENGYEQLERESVRIL